MTLSNEGLTFSQIKPLLIADLKAGLTPALLGEPGIGKSALIEDLSRVFKTKVFTIPVNQLGERSDLTGARITQNEHGDYGQTFFPHQTIMDSIRYAKEHPDEMPILFMDEFNRTSTDITSAILSFQTLREIGNFKFPDNLRMIVAGNDKGNVTSLDKASITRFAVYHVKPDIETFLAVQELNPFVAKVMREHPETLLAEQLQDVIESDDDEDDVFSLSDEFMDDDGFEQQTVPRTITYTSEWLTHLGIDESGSDEELEVIQLLLGATTEQSDTLMKGIIAHAGNTDFSHKLYAVLKNYFNESITGTASSKSAVLGRFKPEQDVINKLSRAEDTTVVAEIVQELDDTEKQSLLIWLFEARSAREVNNNNAVTTAINEIAYAIDELDSEHSSGLNSILGQSKSANEAGIKEFVDTDTRLGKMYRDIASATLGI